MALAELYQGNCLNFIPDLDLTRVKLILTDPPYPDYHTGIYRQTKIEFLRDWKQRQLIFWSAKVDFPLDYSAIHIWDKKTGAGSQYERIFERNGQRNYKVYRYYLINSTVAASYAHDLFTGHLSQKPAGLLRKLIEETTKPGDWIFDPFMGSGSSGVASMQLGRNFIGIELKERNCEIARFRIERARLQLGFEWDT